MAAIILYENLRALFYAPYYAAAERGLQLQPLLGEHRHDVLARVRLPQLRQLVLGNVLDVVVAQQARELLQLHLVEAQRGQQLLALQLAHADRGRAPGRGAACVCVGRRGAACEVVAVAVSA